MPLAPQTRLGPYEILSPLGAGGMGEVYRARDTRLDREVAIKVLPERLANDADALARFEREAKAVAALSHPNILAVHDVGQHMGISYVVMELLEGETLRLRIDRSALPPRKAVEVGIAIADGLSAAHTKGIIHRDLKPENIFITTHGHVKILDFGLARSTSPPQGTPHDLHGSPTLTIETRPGAIIGTLCYMAPEQVRALSTDARTDIFSFGCVLYEMLTGKRAFLGKTAADTMTAILKEEPPSVRAVSAGVEPELERLIDRCLEKGPEQRFQSSADLAYSLRSIASRAGHPASVVGSLARRLMMAGAAVVLLVAAVVIGRWILGAGSGVTPREARDAIDSLAVLPLENVSRDPEQEIFVDGMTEALISDLAKIGSLKVISRTSVMRYKATTKSLPEIARELNVDAVVEGSVLRVGERVRITAQLIHAPTQENLWAESYEHDLRDVLRLQSEVARTIAQEIKVTLTPQEQARMAAARPVINPEAHQAYLKGRFYWNKRTAEGLKKAVGYFDQAIDLAPDWPLGYAGLADAYALMPQYAPVHPGEAVPKAKAAAAKALKMDESLAEAHSTLGWIASRYDWDWSAAERAFQRALALSPNYETAHLWYGLHLLLAGRHDEAMREINKAHELDPLSLVIMNTRGSMHYLAWDFAQAEVWFRKALELDADFVRARANLANTLFMQQKFAPAVTEAREALRLSDNSPRSLAQAGYIFGKAGRNEEAREILDRLSSTALREYVAPTHFALVQVGLDERDEAFEWLEKAYEERDALLTLTLTDPYLAPMRTDPRFIDLVRRVGLPPQAPMPNAFPSRAREEAETLQEPRPLSDGRGSDTPDGSHAPSGRIMLAVLPFENLSRDPDQEYFSDGMTDEMISQLGQIDPESLEVIARTSAMQYKKTTKNVDQIGRELKVDYVVEGSVRRADDRVRITTRLIDVQRQTRLWGESFNCDLKDILALQSDVAQAVARQVNVKLIPQGQGRRATIRPVIPAAHEAYMRGRFHWHNREREGMQKALEYFHRAIKLDPDYAPAYAGLADAHTHLARHGNESPNEAFLLAKQAARKSVELDPASAEAHAALAAIALYFDWDWNVAERELRQALDLNPSFEEAHHQYSHLHLTMGRPQESLTETQRALDLNPLDPLLNMHLGWHYMMTRQHDLGIAQLNSVLEINANHYQTLRHIGWAYMYAGLHAGAITALETATKVMPDSAQAMTALAAAYATAGRGSDAQALLTELEAWPPSRYVSACDLAAVYAALKEVDAAIAWLEKAIGERSPRIIELGLDPVFDPLHTDPRFADLLRRVGLPPLPPPPATPTAP